MKKGAYVLHMSGDELDCFSDFLKKWDCPVDMLLCVLDSILHQDHKLVVSVCVYVCVCVCVCVCCVCVCVCVYACV